MGNSGKVKTSKLQVKRRNWVFDVAGVSGRRLSTTRASHYKKRSERGVLQGVHESRWWRRRLNIKRRKKPGSDYKTTVLMYMGKQN